MKRLYLNINKATSAVFLTSPPKNKLKKKKLHNFMMMRFSLIFFIRDDKKKDKEKLFKFKYKIKRLYRGHLGHGLGTLLTFLPRYKKI